MLTYSPINCRYQGCAFSDFAQLLQNMLREQESRIPDSVIIYLSMYDYEVIDSFDIINILDSLTSEWWARLPFVKKYIFKKRLVDKKFLTQKTAEYVVKKVNDRVYKNLMQREGY